MSLTPEQARELLEADEVNLVELVKAGQPLSARHKKALEDIAKKPAPAVAAPVPSAPAFTLTASSAPTTLSAEILAEYQRIYQISGRNLRRYWNDGAPLHDPTLVPAWWESERAAGRKVWSCPEKILLAAKLAAASSPPASEPAPSASAAAPAPSSLPTPPVTSDAIHLEDLDPDEGDRLRELKQIQRGRFLQLRDALAAGHDTTLLETKYLKLTETIDKMESRVSERLKKRGLYILRPEVERDIAKAAELIRQMGESEVRRVLEQCPLLDPLAREQVTAAIRDLAAARARVFRTLKSLRSTEDADQLLLTAA